MPGELADIFGELRLYCKPKLVYPSSPSSVPCCILPDVRSSSGGGGSLTCLACPYLKYDPKTYGRRKSCRGACFDSTHRLKEHLYRTHRQKPNCPRCHDIFTSEAEVDDHLKSKTPCEVKESLAIEGFNAVQEKELRSKKRIPGVVTDGDKWKGIFKILFPDRTEIPSPLYNFSFSDDEGASSQEKPAGSDEAQRQEACLPERFDQADEIQSTLNQKSQTELQDEFILRVEDAIGGSLTLEKKRKLIDVSKDFAVKMLKHSKEDRGREKGKGLLGVPGSQELTMEPTANLASTQVHEEDGSSSTLASALPSEEGIRSQKEVQPTTTQNISEANHLEGDSHSIPAGAPDFDGLFGDFDFNAEPDFNAMFAVYEDQPPADALGGGSEAVGEGEATEIVREGH